MLTFLMSSLVVVGLGSVAFANPNATVLSPSPPPPSAFVAAASSSSSIPPPPSIHSVALPNATASSAKTARSLLFAAADDGTPRLASTSGCSYPPDPDPPKAEADEFCRQNADKPFACRYFYSNAGRSGCYFRSGCAELCNGASCASMTNWRCNGLEGDCCPTSDGVFLDCCRDSKLSLPMELTGSKFG